MRALSPGSPQIRTLIVAAVLVGLALAAGTAGAAGTGAPPPPKSAAPLTCDGFQTVASPNYEATTAVLAGVAAAGPGDVWATGAYRQGTHFAQTLIEHWDGDFWSVVPSPAVISGTSTLAAVAVVAPDDVWAVGDLNAGEPSPGQQPLVAHWNGTAWDVVPAFFPGGVASSFTGVAAVAADDIWAVGSVLEQTGDTAPLIQHWDGHAWTVVAARPSPADVLRARSRRAPPSTSGRGA